MPLILQQLNDELAAVVEKVRNSLVQVQNGRSGAGAGTLLHADGLIVTNAHVVQRRQPQVVLWDGRSERTRLRAIGLSWRAVRAGEASVWSMMSGVVCRAILSAAGGTSEAASPSRQAPPREPHCLIPPR